MSADDVTAYVVIGNDIKIKMLQEGFAVGAL